jgi:glycosyltransferase involved in cell wall biosynthesis
VPNALFVAPRGFEQSDAAGVLNVSRIGLFHGHAWEQIDLPAYLASKGFPLLINLGNTGPLAYSNQISTLHDIAFVRHPDSFSRAFRFAYTFLVPRLLRRSRALVTVSEFSKKEIAAHYHYPVERILVVPNAAGAQFAVREHSNPSERPFLLAVSSPNRHKNFERVLDAYREWDGRHGADLLIVGNQAPAFASQAFRDIPAGVRFVGRVSDQELIALYSTALGFVFPSLYEGFGIPPLEAQACGCPVIASAAASIPEVLRDSAIYFDPMDVESIRDAMTALLNSPEVRADLTKKGVENVARFSWVESAARIADLAMGLT